MCDTVVTRDVMSGIERFVCVVEMWCVNLLLTEERRELTGSLKQSPSSETKTEAHFAILQPSASLSCSTQLTIFLNYDHNNSVHALISLII